MAMTYPAFTVWFAPGIDASAVPGPGDWVDITARVLARWSVKWGRWSEFSESGAGTAELDIANNDGEFDPSNAGGTYYGQLVAGCWFRILGGTTTANTDVFYGHVDDRGFQRGTPSQFPDQYVTVRLVDDLEQLANTALPSSVYVIEVEADAPEAWWRLGESSGTVATDSSGNGHHGEYTDGATFNSRAGLIDGEADNALLINPGRLTLPSGRQVRSDWDFTVEGWVDIPDTVAYDGTIFRQSNHGELTPGGSYSSVFVGFRAVASEAWPYVEVIVNGSAAADGTWRLASSALTAGKHYIAAVIPAAAAVVPDNMLLYVDGAVDGGSVGGALATMPAFPSNLIYTDAGSDATLDEIAVYDGELGPDRIQAHYLAGTAPWSGETSGTRVGHILDAVDYDATNRNIELGQSTLQAADLGGSDAASSLSAVAKAELGSIYVDHQDGGKVRFLDRHERWTATASITSQATCGDSGSEVTYDAIALEDDRIINVASVQRRGGATVTATDATSAGARRRTFSESGLLYETDAESGSRANKIVAEKKDRHEVPRTIVLRPRKSTHSAWAHVFARKVDDRITVKWRPTYGITNTYDAWIDGIEHRWSARDGLATTFYLTPVPYGATAEPYFIVGTSTVSGPARIGY